MNPAASFPAGRARVEPSSVAAAPRATFTNVGHLTGGSRLRCMVRDCDRLAVLTAVREVDRGDHVRVLVVRYCDGHAVEAGVVS